jgi:hypothetical protein
VKLTSVRLDRFYTAVEGVVEKGLFEVEASNYYHYRYQIAEKFLEKHPTFFTPHLPKKGIDFRKSETISVFRNDPPKNGDIPNNTFTSFNQTTQQQPKQPHQQSVEKKQAEISPPTEIDVVDEVKNEVINFRDEAEIDVVVNQMKNEVIDSSDNAEKEVIVDEVKQAINIDLPPIIDKKHYSACHKALHGLTVDQQQRVFKVIEINQKNKTMTSPVGLLIHLSKAEREGRLTIPKRQYHPSHKPFEATKTTSYHPSHRPFEATEKPIPHDENQDNTILDDHLGKLNWLKDRAHLTGQSIPDFADSMLMSSYLKNTQFVQRWLISVAKGMQQPVEQLAKALGLSGYEAT